MFHEAQVFASLWVKYFAASLYEEFGHWPKLHLHFFPGVNDFSVFDASASSWYDIDIFELFAWKLFNTN